MSEPARRSAVWTEGRRGSDTGRRRAQAPRGRAGTRRAAPGPRTARSASLRLVADGGRLVPHVPAHLADAGQVPVRTLAGPRALPAQDRAARPDRARRPDHAGSLDRAVCPDHAAQSAPLRLTRRGRIVITAAAALTIGAVSLVLAGTAQATGHSGAPGASAARGAGVVRVVIRTGQSLWSVAEAYDPNTDTRLVILQILRINSLNSDQLQPGQVLWVPRG